MKFFTIAVFQLLAITAMASAMPKAAPIEANAEAAQM
jgi:hypothetical protein